MAVVMTRRIPSSTLECEKPRGTGSERLRLARCGNRAPRRNPQSPIPNPDAPSIFAWWRDADARAHNAFIAASLGWMLDSFDVMLYAMVLAALIEDPVLHLSLATAGILN